MVRVVVVVFGPPLSLNPKPKLSDAFLRNSVSGCMPGVGCKRRYGIQWIACAHRRAGRTLFMLVLLGRLEPQLIGG